jgi:hypothetical protein
MAKLKCDWCGSAGHIIGDAKSFPGSRTVKCDVCCHEWETIIDEKDFTPKDHEDRSKWRNFTKFLKKRLGSEWI